MSTQTTNGFIGALWCSFLSEEELDAVDDTMLLPTEAERNALVRNALVRQAVKAAYRRFDESARVTGFGELA
jgi:hypothetical protein